jgi:hypothetical protein
MKPLPVAARLHSPCVRQGPWLAWRSSTSARPGRDLAVQLLLEGEGAEGGQVHARDQPLVQLAPGA